MTLHVAMKFVVYLGFIASISVNGSASAAGVDSCSQMLVETPGSVNARVCFAREMELLEKRMSTVVDAIEAEVVKGSTSFKLDDFRSAQRDWRKFVASTCWLDAAGAGNTDAVFQNCSSKYTLQRLAQLQVMNSSLMGKPVMWPMSDLSVQR